MAKFFLSKILTSSLKGSDLEKFKNHFHATVKEMQEKIYCPSSPLVYLKLKQGDGGGYAMGFVIEEHKNCFIVATCLHAIEDSNGKVFERIQCEKVYEKKVNVLSKLLGAKDETISHVFKIVNITFAEDGSDLAFIKLSKNGFHTPLSKLSKGALPAQPRLCFMVRRNSNRLIELFSGAIDPSVFSYVTKYDDGKPQSILVPADKHLKGEEWNGIRHLVVRSNGAEGCSGGPVFDAEWKIYGLVTTRGADNEVTIIPIKRILNYLDKIRGEFL